MATFSALVNGVLPPAGGKLYYHHGHQAAPTYKGYEPYWVDSGTSALALAIIGARNLKPRVVKPEVILPAYGCPDLVSAAIYAKAKPVLVDINADQPSYNLEKLAQAINTNTIAAVAVNFLGLSDNLKSIKKTIGSDIYLIEDNAQCYLPLHTPEQLQGDFVITSFGRGKPVSLLGGGLCLKSEKLSVSLKSYIKPSPTPKLLKFKFKIYNMLIKPLAYQLLARNPLLRLGETQYKVKKTITEIDELRKGWVANSIQKYINKNNDAQSQLISSLKTLNTQAPETIGPIDNSTIKYLRVPLICKSKQQRDQLYQQLTDEGLGASIMYGTALINIPNISALIGTYATPAAESFSDRLLTLPCHQGVTAKHIRRICDAIASFALSDSVISK